MDEEKIRHLIARWRMFARGGGDTPWADGINRCADELETALVNYEFDRIVKEINHG